jgi:hypothetical protein
MWLYTMVFFDPAESARIVRDLATRATTTRAVLRLA